MSHWLGARQLLQTPSSIHARAQIGRTARLGFPPSLVAGVPSLRPFSTDYSDFTPQRRLFGTPSSPFGSKKRKPLMLAIVPQQEAWIVERFGKFSKVLEGGLHFLIPVMETISYQQSMKEVAISIPNQSAFIENVSVMINGVLYVKIVDPVKASYGVSDLHYAMVQLAQTTMRSELGKMTLDRTFAEREALNNAIVNSINQASEEAWGVRCLRYEIRDITPPPAVQEAMELQVAAERKKRAKILDSEGVRQSEINTADGQKQAVMLAAEGEAQATIVRAEAVAEGVNLLAAALEAQGGSKAASLRLAEQYIEAFGKLAHKGTTMLLPSAPGDASSMVATAVSIFNKVSEGKNSLGQVGNSESDLPDFSLEKAIQEHENQKSGNLKQ